MWSGTGGGPEERGRRSPCPGDRSRSLGPGGKIFLAEGADWHLFAGDESSLAVVFAMASALPSGTPGTVILEVPEPADEQDLDVARPGRPRWRQRAGPRAGAPPALAAALSSVSLPPGPGHVYLFGEAKVVLRLREVAAERGLSGDQVSAKAYWGRGRANASHGEQIGRASCRER